MKPMLALLAAATLAGTALAAPKFESAYTKIGTENASCKELESNPEEGGSFLMRCPGHSGIAVFVSEGDLRMSVSYGWNAKGERAYGQTFSYFNSVGDTLEWRLKDGKPFATILRWKISGGGDLPKGDVLVVTQLDEGNQCWVAMVSANKNTNANELARQAADEIAGTVRCTDETKAKVYGTPDPALME